MKADRTECNERRHVVVVLGMHRSGTSVVARALESIGVEFGDALHGSRFDNAKGFYEDRDIQRANDKLLSQMGCRWNTIVVPTLSKRTRSQFKEEVVDLVSCKSGASAIWGFKDPRTSRLLPFWQDVLDSLGLDIHYIVAVRNPFSVAASLAKRNKMPRSAALALWLNYEFNTLKVLKKQECLVVDYDFILSRPWDQIERIARYLTIDTPSKTKHILKFVNEFLDCELRHAQHGLQKIKFNNDCLEAICCQTYGHLREWAQARDKPREELKRETSQLMEKIAGIFREQHGLFEAIDILQGTIDFHYEHTIPKLKRNFNSSTQRISQLEKELVDVRGSLSFRIGRLVTYPFRSLARGVFARLPNAKRGMKNE